MGAYLCKDAEHAKQAKQDETENQMLPASEKIKKQEKDEIVDGENPDIPFADATVDEEDIIVNETPDSHSCGLVVTNISHSTNIDQKVNEENVVEIQQTLVQESPEICKNDVDQETCPEKSQDLHEHIVNDFSIETCVEAIAEEHHIQKSENSFKEESESHNPSSEQTEEILITDQISNVPEITDQREEEEPIIVKNEEHIQNSVEIHDELTNQPEEVREHVEVIIDLNIDVPQNAETCDNSETHANVDNEIQKSTETDHCTNECIVEDSEKPVHVVEENTSPLQSSDFMLRSEDVIEKQEYEFQESSEIEKELVSIINEEHVKDLSENEAIKISSDDSLMEDNSHQEINIISEKNLDEEIVMTEEQTPEILVVEDMEPVERDEENLIDVIESDKLEEDHEIQVEDSGEKEQIEVEIENQEESNIEKEIEDHESLEGEQVNEESIIEDQEHFEEVSHVNEKPLIEDQEHFEEPLIKDQEHFEEPLIGDHEACEVEISQVKEESLVEDQECIEEKQTEDQECIEEKQTEDKECIEEKQTEDIECIEDQQTEDQECIKDEKLEDLENVIENQEQIEEKVLVEELEQVEKNENNGDAEEKNDECCEDEALVEDQDYDEELIVEDQDLTDELVEDLEQVRDETSKTEVPEQVLDETNHEVECVDKEETCNKNDHQLKDTNTQDQEVGHVNFNVNTIEDIELNTQPVSTNGQSKSDDDQSISNDIEIGNEIEDVKEEELIKMVSDAVEEIMGDAKTEVQHIVENSASKEPQIEAMEC